MANDTTTELDLGAGGDVMNESLVTQSDGETEAKSPRVVLIQDDGRIADRGSPQAVGDDETHELLRRIATSLEAIQHLLMAIASQ